MTYVYVRSLVHVLVSCRLRGSRLQREPPLGFHRLLLRQKSTEPWHDFMHARTDNVHIEKMLST